MAPTRFLPSLPSLTLLLTTPALAQDFDVLDLGASGSQNQTWSISNSGHVAGYAAFGATTEGFVYVDGQVEYVGIPAGTSRSDMLGINDVGSAVGKSGLTFEDGQAILWQPGEPLQSLGTLGGSRSAGIAINNMDQIVGWSDLTGDEESRPFLYEDGMMAALPILGGTQGQATWINDSGQIVGTTTTDTDGLQQFAVLWDGGDPVRLPPFHAGQNNLVDYIHNNGDIAGSVRIPDEINGGFKRRAAIWRDGEIHQILGTLADGSGAEPFALSWASGINSSGEIVGMSVNAASSLVPFLYRDGEMIQLDELMPDGWIADFIGSGAINDAGQITVSGFMPQGTRRALLLTPNTSAVEGPEHRRELNVFATGSRILYSIEEPAPVSVELFDLRGSRVATVEKGWREAGTHEVEWMERDANGRSAASGVYFARVKTPNHQGTARIFVVR